MLAPIEVIAKPLIMAYVFPNGCWHFIGGRTKKGYGSLRFEGKAMGAHRTVYCLDAGIALEEIEGLMVRHTCDNPPCIRPSHLEIGTAADNNRDREERGRAVYLPGELNGQSKLTAAQVLDIRKDSRTLKAIGKEYGVDHTTISLIKNRKKWKHI